MWTSFQLPVKLGITDLSGKDHSVWVPKESQGACLLDWWWKCISVWGGPSGSSGESFTRAANSGGLNLSLWKIRVIALVQSISDTDKWWVENEWGCWGLLALMSYRELRVVGAVGTSSRERREFEIRCWSWLAVSVGWWDVLVSKIINEKKSLVKAYGDWAEYCELWSLHEYT